MVTHEPIKNFQIFIIVVTLKKDKQCLTIQRQNYRKNQHKKGCISLNDTTFSIFRIQWFFHPWSIAERKTTFESNMERNTMNKKYSIRRKISFIYSLVFYLCVLSEDTLSFFLPLALLEANTLRPLVDSIFLRNPCLFFLRLFEGW